MASKDNSLWLILLVIAAIFIVPKLELFSSFEDFNPTCSTCFTPTYVQSFVVNNVTYDYRGSFPPVGIEGSGVRMSVGATNAGQTGVYRAKLPSDWQIVDVEITSTFDLKTGSGTQANCDGGAGVGVVLGWNAESVFSRGLNCGNAFLDPPPAKVYGGTLTLIKTGSGRSADAYFKQCETCNQLFLKTVPVGDLFFSLSASHNDDTDRGGSAFGYFSIQNLRINNISELMLLQGKLSSLEQNIAFLNSTLEQKAATLKGLQLTLDEYSEVINKLQLEVDEKASLMRALELTVTEYSEIIRKLELRVADEAAVANQLELDLAQMINLTNSLQLRLDEQLVFLNNLNLNLAEKEALVRQLHITNAEQEALLSQMRGSFAEQAAILDGLNLTLQDDAKQISGLELSLQAQGGIIDALRLNLSEMQELISFLKLSNEEKIELIRSLNLTVQEQQRLIDELKLTPVLEVQKLCENTDGAWSSKNGCVCPLDSGKVFVTGKGCEIVKDAGGAPIFGGIDNKMFLWIGGIIGGLIILRRLL